MKKSFAYHARANFVWLVIVPLLLIAPAGSAIAAELKEAHVTRIIKDVQLLPSQAAPRPAVVNDNVRSGTAVRTGADSRTELTFTDLTLARLGANTIFSFNEGTRNLDLGGGAVLLHVPKGAGGAKITTAAITAGITGTTVLMEYHRNAYIKFIVLEGTARMYLKNHLGESVLIGPGQMLIVKPNATSLPDPVTVDLKRLVQTCLLITEFAPLASQPLILQQIQIQQNNPDLITTNLVIYGRGTLVSLVDPTNVNVISQATTAIATPTPSPTPVPTPSKFGTPSVITSPDPYVITSGTTISTDPMITTNGVTDFGKIWRGQMQDGPLSAFIFGSTSAFDIASGFDAEINGQNGSGGAVFKFTSLQLTGNPTISTPTGVINLGLIAVNGITSGGPGGTLTFAGIRGLLIATQDGSINLGSEIAFSGIHDINFYARGAGSNLTLGSAISAGTRIRLWAQGTIRINGDENAPDFRAFSGGDFLAGSGTITAQTIDIESLSNINIDSRQFPNFTGNFNVNAAGTLNATLHPGSGGTTHFNGTSLTAHGNTINVQSSVNPTTFDLGTATVSFTGGSGGIQAPDILFANGSSLLLRTTNGGDINIYGTQNGTGSDTIIAGGAFTSQSDVSALTLQAGTSITIGGSASARDFVEAGTAINVGGELSALSVIAGTNITAGDITILDATGPTSDGNVDISARDQISITNGVDINRKFGGASSGLDVLINAGTDLTAGGSFMVNVDNSVNGNLNTGAIIGLNAGRNLAINGGGTLSLTIDNGGGGHIGIGGEISVGTGGDLTTSGGVALTIQNTTGTINNGGDITLTGSGSISSAQALTLLLENYDFTAHPAGHIGTGGNIFVTTGGNLTANSIDALINNRSGGTIGSGGNMSFNIAGALTTSGDAGFVIETRFDNHINGSNVGSMIGSNVTLTVSAGSVDIGGSLASDTFFGPNPFSGISNISSTIDGSATYTWDVSGNTTIHGDADFEILNNGHADSGAVVGGTIHGNALVQVTAGSFSANSISSAFIANQDGGVIDSSATVTFNIAGNITTLGNLTTPGDASFTIFNQNNGSLGELTGGSIGSNATVNISAANLSIGHDLDVEIDNLNNGSGTGGSIGGNAAIDVNAANITTGGALDATINNSGGTIGGEAIINMNISGNATVTNDATFQILGNDPSGSAAINFNGGSYAIGSPGSGGMFLGSIDGNGTITFNNASVHADVIKAGVFGANGVLNIGGGVLTADTQLKLYAPGSNGQLNFTANVTLDGISSKILAANSVTIFNNVVVTIGDDVSATVYTNHPNYTGFGGNGSTTGTFGGVGANQPLPLTQAPPFGPAASRNGGAANTDGNTQTLSSTNVASSGRVEGSNVKTASRKATGVAINVGSTDALLSLLDGTAPGPGGKITIPASKSTSNSRNPSRINAAGPQKVDPGALDIRTASSLPARRLPQ